MARMKAVQANTPGVSDMCVKGGLWPGLRYPRAPVMKSPGGSTRYPLARAQDANRQMMSGKSFAEMAIAWIRNS